MQHSTSKGRRKDKQRYGNGGQQWWWMATVANDDNTHDWVVDCNGEGQDWAVRDSRDIRVLMMAAMAEDGGRGQQWQRWTTTAADDNRMQDWAADYNRKGQEWAARDGGDSGVAMMAVAAEVGGGRQGWRRRMMMATVDNNSGGRQRRLTTKACKIGWQITRGKEESRRQTTTALDISLISPLGREREKNKEIEFTQKDFLQQYSLSGWIFCSHQNTDMTFLVYQS
jgi:hypothetical protein